MAIRIPQNQIVNKYTAGKEYILETTYEEYIGYYYDLNNRTFAGKEFNPNALILIKNTPENTNKLLSNPLTNLYGQISNIIINNSTPSSFVYNYESDVRYFIYQINKKIIKEINKDTFEAFKVNPLYNSVSLSFTSGFNDQEINIAERKIPGIREFTESSYTNPPVEEDGTVG